MSRTPTENEVLGELVEDKATILRVSEEEV